MYFHDLLFNFYLFYEQKLYHMARILTGIQSSGRPHLGNILGAIKPAIELSKDPKNESLFFIADLHSLTTVKDPEQRKSNTYAVAAAWLACGFDTERNLFYRQSRVSEVCELTWHLSCFTPFPMLANATSFKEKSDRLADVNGGIFIYPVLMASDIILYDANFVPVGKDQKQHLEMTRDIAQTFNKLYGDTFVIPEPIINEEVMIIPGLDGQKMSKSYNNTLDIFLPEKKLRKQVMSIITDSTPLEDPKDPDTCTVFNLYKILAPKEKMEVMRKNYLNGNYGYGQAKQELFELILENFHQERILFDQYINNTEMLENKLCQGEERAREISRIVLNKVRKKLGFL